MNIRIKRYKKEYKPEVVELMRLNVPRYFHPSEVQEFEQYLEFDSENYFIAEENGRIAGGGGVNDSIDPAVAKISWDIVHPDFQGKGIGRALTLHRIGIIKENPAFREVMVRTSQMAYQFYEKSGFVLVHVEKDFWADGYDLYEMKMVLTGRH